MRHGIVEPLASMATPLDEIARHPDNPNVGDVHAVAMQMSSHGQTKPIVVQRSTGRIVAGNHRYLAACMLGWTHIAALMLDVDDHGARRILVGDNLPARGSREDEDQLTRILAVIATSPTGRLDATGYGPDELAELLGKTGIALQRPPDPKGPAPEGIGGDLTSTDAEIWPVLRIEVDHDTHRRWTAAVADHGDGARLLAELLEVL